MQVGKGVGLGDDAVHVLHESAEPGAQGQVGAERGETAFDDGDAAGAQGLGLGAQQQVLAAVAVTLCSHLPFLATARHVPLHTYCARGPYVAC